MRLRFDNDILKFLQNIENCDIIVRLLLNGNETHLTNEGNYIKSFEDDKISYLPKSKYEIDDIWNKGRVNIKIGRFIRKIIKKEAIERYGITDSSIENFVNLYKSYFNRDYSKLKIVSGSEIKKYYHQDYYHIFNGMRFGSLWNSCMRQPERNMFLDLYSENECIKMLVLLDDDERVKSRALLWNGVQDKNGNKYNFMDRIYSFYDHDVNFFIDWAKENGYIYKHQQNAKSESSFIKDNDVEVAKLSIKLDNFDFDYYPYLDTFKYMTNDGIFHNWESDYFNYCLIQSDGSKYRDEEEMCEEFDENEDF